MEQLETPLATIELTGWRWLLRQGGLSLVVVVAAVTGVAAFLWENHLVITIPAFLLAYGAALATGRGHPHATWIGAASLAGGLLGLVLSVIAKEETPLAMAATQLGLLALCLLGAPLLALDPLVYRLERAHQRREHAREFPTARLVVR